MQIALNPTKPNMHIDVRLASIYIHHSHLPIHHCIDLLRGVAYSNVQEILMLNDLARVYTQHDCLWRMLEDEAQCYFAFAVNFEL